MTMLEHNSMRSGTQRSSLTGSRISTSSLAARPSRVPRRQARRARSDPQRRPRVRPPQYPHQRHLSGHHRNPDGHADDRLRRPRPGRGRGQPAHRAARTAEEMAAAVLWLCSPGVAVVGETAPSDCLASSPPSSYWPDRRRADRLVSRFRRTVRDAGAHGRTKRLLVGDAVVGDAGIEPALPAV
jgi:hypothetical protein